MQLFKSKFVSFPYYLIIFSISIIIASNLHIEWLWFKQFDLSSVFLTKIYIKSFVGLLSILFTYLLIRWQARWIRISQPHRRIENKESGQFKGIVFGTLLLASYLIINLSLILLLLIAWISLTNAFHVTYWWKYTSEINLVMFTLITSFLSTIMLFINKKSGSLVLQLFGSIILCCSIVRSWAVWALAFSIPSSGIVEPVYGSDISFGLAQYPALILILFQLLLFNIYTISISIWLYLSSKSRITDWSAAYFNRDQKNHLRPMLMLSLAISLTITWLSRHQFLWTDNDIVPGAGWLDIHFNIPMRSISCLALVVLFFLFIPIKYKHKKIIRIVSSIIFLLTVTIEFIMTPFLQWIIVRPRELVLESLYIQRAIKSTRKAFQLDSIETKLINPKSRLTNSDLNSAKSTLRNLRLWDSQPLLATNSQLQQLRQYYRFTNVAIDRYQLKASSNERQQVMITARELDQKQLPETSRTWLNKHFVFTHGYGFTVSPINSKAEDGLPEYFIRDLGTSTKIQGSSSLDIDKKEVEESIPIGRAAIYYGMLPTKYVIAPSKIKELDYPQGDNNIFNHYEGTGGIELNNIIRKLTASIHIREPRLLTTGSLTKKSRLLIKREVRQRMKSLAPFLNVISEPYLISVNIKNRPIGYNNTQNQYWIVEGYTTSYTYPYASKLSDSNPIRYIRNSVKAVVDAYNGTIKLYISEPNDPIIKAWSKIFPEMFQHIDNLPLEIKEHLRVPIELFNVKVQQILRYHVSDSRTFYNGDDVWQVPMELYGSLEVPIEPYHITAQLGENTESEFLLLQPLSPLARPNLTAWLAARNDGKNYGQLVLLRFPSQTSIFGPEQIQALINQNPQISQQFSLWDRAGSEVIQGNLLVLPIGKSLLYVEPVYLKASTGGLPTLTRIVVSDGKRIVMSDTLAKAIEELVSNSYKD